jgi:hypothetical protein
MTGWHLAGYVSLVAAGFSIAMARVTHGVSPGQWAGAGLFLLIVGGLCLSKAEQK